MRGQQRRLMRIGYVALICLISVVFARAWPEKPAQIPARDQATYDVVEVFDGDTIAIAKDGKIEKVRFIGVDTPETKDPRKPVQCFGREASEFTKQLLKGAKVRIEYDPVVGERDRYQRLLAYVWKDSGLFVNQELVVEGYAHEYTYQNQLYKYRDQFQREEANARSAQRGLWSATTCNGKTE